MASVEEIVLASSKSIAANGESDLWDALHHRTVEVEAVWSGADAVDGTLALHRGLSSSAMSAHAAATTMNAASGTARWTIEPFGGRFLKVVIAKGSNSAGTVTIRALGK